MSKIKRSIFLVGALVLALTGCGSSGEKEDASQKNEAGSGTETVDDAEKGGAGQEKYTIGMVTYMMAQEWYQNIVSGAQERADAQGITLKVADANNDATKQVELVENMITQGVDAIIISPVDTKALASVIKKAQDAGIRVVCESNMVEGADTRVGVSDKECGRSVGKWFAEYANNNGIEPKILILGYESLENCKNRSEGFKEALDESGLDYEIVIEVDGGFKEESMNATIDALTAKPEINVVFGINDDSTLGAVSAIRQVGSINDFTTILYGVEGMAGREALKNDELITAGLCSFPEYVGSVCIDAAVEAIQGNGAKEYISPTVVIEKNEFDTYFLPEGDTYVVNFDAVELLTK